MLALGAILTLAVLGSSWWVHEHEHSTQVARQHAVEFAGLRALSESVAQSLTREHILAETIAALHAPVGARWPVLAQQVLADPAVSGAAYVVPVSGRDRASFERTTGISILTLTKSGHALPAPRRPQYWVVVADAQRSPSSSAGIGTDLAENPLRSALLARAATTDQQVASAPVRFLSKTPGMHVIVFEAVRAGGRLQGWITASYTPARLVADALALSPGLRISIRDGGAPLIANKLGPNTLSTRLTVGQREWTVSAWVPAGAASIVPWLIAALELTLSGVVVVLLRSAASRERYALSEVERHLAIERERQAELDAQRAQTAQARDHAEAIIQAMAEGYALIVDGRLVTVNDPLCEITGFERAELSGQAAPYPFWPPEQHAQLTELTADLLAQSGTTFEVVLMRKDHERFDAEVTMRAARGADGRVFGHVITLTDVSEQRRAQREQAALAVLGRLVAENAEPQEVFDGIAERVLALFGADRGEIVRLDPEADAPEIVAVSFAGMAGSEAIELNVISAPVIIAGDCWGALRVAFRNHPIPPDTERILKRFADLAALAVANASAREKLARQATTDPVTGLANHRAFQETLLLQIVHARRYGRRLNLVLLDLDHFKQVNDTHGHPAGDRALREVARRLRGQARTGELIARIGGEEFAWLIPEADAEGAYQAAERARRAISGRPFEGIGRLSISAGVAALTPELDQSGLLRCADRALYWAKDGGRDSTFLYTVEADALLSSRGETLNRVQAISTIKGLARTVDAKHPGTAEHSEKVAMLAEGLALASGWAADRAARLREAAFLHDIGKIAAREELLLKPGPLTSSEYAEIKHHADLSARIAATVLDEEQTSWIRGHHERWDGSGYPDGLEAEQIPDGAQLLALADAFEAMTSDRVYRVALTAAEALAECRAQSGLQFAPAAVSALLASMIAQDNPDFRGNLEPVNERVTSDGI